MTSNLDMLDDDSTRKLASIFHYLIIDQNMAQYYHELRYLKEGDLETFNDIISRAQKDIQRLLNNEEERKRMKNDNVRIPDMNDIAKINKLFKRWGKKYITIILSLATSYCRNK